MVARFIERLNRDTNSLIDHFNRLSFPRSPGQLTEFVGSGLEVKLDKGHLALADDNDICAAEGVQLVTQGLASRPRERNGLTAGIEGIVALRLLVSNDKSGSQSSFGLDAGNFAGRVAGAAGIERVIHSLNAGAFQVRPRQSQRPGKGKARPRPDFACCSALMVVLYSL